MKYQNYDVMKLNLTHLVLLKLKPKYPQLTRLSTYEDALTLLRLTPPDDGIMSNGNLTDDLYVDISAQSSDDELMWGFLSSYDNSKANANMRYPNYSVISLTLIHFMSLKFRLRSIKLVGLLMYENGTEVTQLGSVYPNNLGESVQMIFNELMLFPINLLLGNL